MTYIFVYCLLIVCSEYFCRLVNKDPSKREREAELLCEEACHICGGSDGGDGCNCVTEDDDEPAPTPSDKFWYQLKSIRNDKEHSQEDAIDAVQGLLARPFERAAELGNLRRHNGLVMQPNIVDNPRSTGNAVHIINIIRRHLQDFLDSKTPEELQTVFEKDPSATTVINKHSMLRSYLQEERVLHRLLLAAETRPDSLRNILVKAGYTKDSSEATTTLRPLSVAGIILFCTETALNKVNLILKSSATIMEGRQAQRDLAARERVDKKFQQQIEAAQKKGDLFSTYKAESLKVNVPGNNFMRNATSALSITMNEAPVDGNQTDNKEDDANYEEGEQQEEEKKKENGKKEVTKVNVNVESLSHSEIAAIFRVPLQTNQTGYQTSLVWSHHDDVKKIFRESGLKDAWVVVPHPMRVKQTKETVYLLYVGAIYKVMSSDEDTVGVIFDDDKKKYDIHYSRIKLIEVQEKRAPKQSTSTSDVAVTCTRQPKGAAVLAMCKAIFDDSVVSGFTDKESRVITKYFLSFLLLHLSHLSD